jgi:alkylhydroperoxidase family enzyme
VIVDRAAVGVLNALGRSLWGFPPRLMAALVDRGGALRTLAWFAANMPRYELTRRALGALRTHLITTSISLVNGCEYCAFGHGYAMELIYLREHGTLFPRSVDELLALRRHEPDEIRAELADALEAAGLPDEVPWIERAIALTAGTAQPTANDARLTHLVAMFALLNGTGIACGTEPDEAHDPVNKDVALKERLRSLRAAA